jgi:hypothetical protein
VHDPENHDLSYKGQLNQSHFYSFLTFVKYTTNIRVTFVQNVKKVKNRPTLLFSVLLSGLLGLNIFNIVQVGWYSEDDGLNIKNNIFPDFALQTTTTMTTVF